MKLLSTCTRFMFQSQTTRTFIWGRLLRPTNSLWLPLAGSMHSVPSIANRAPGNGSSVMLDFIHTCSSFGGKQITSLHRRYSSSTTRSACMWNVLNSTPSREASSISVPLPNKYRTPHATTVSTAAEECLFFLYHRWKGVERFSVGLFSPTNQLTIYWKHS